MKVILTDKFYFLVEEDSYNLYKAQVPKIADDISIKPHFVIDGYFTSIPRLINRVVQHTLANERSEVDLEGFLVRFEALQNKLIGILPSTLKDDV